MIDWEAAFDPSELLDYVMDFQGGTDPLLEAGEKIASYTLNVTAPAAALGLEISTDPAYAAGLQMADTRIKLWLQIDPAFQAAPVFSEGATLGVEATITTTNVPPRIRQRTFNLHVRQL